MTESPDAMAASLSQMKRLIRVFYSNPPSTVRPWPAWVLEDEELRTLWSEEVDAMRRRIAEVREALVEGLNGRDTGRDFSFIARQNGNVLLQWAHETQVNFLREEKGIYVVGGGRINVAGLTPSDMDYVCDSIAESLKA